MFVSSLFDLGRLERTYAVEWALKASQLSTTRWPGLACILMTLPVRLCFIVQELCESRGGRPGLSVLTSLLVSVDVKLY